MEDLAQLRKLVRYLQTLEYLVSVAGVARTDGASPEAQIRSLQILQFCLPRIRALNETLEENPEAIQALRQAEQADPPS